MNRVRVVVEGWVQGVGFRAWAAREARSLGLAGAVWNRADGAVEVEAEGERAALERLVEAMRVGPSAAHVTGLTSDWSEGPPRYRGFQVAATRRE